MFENKCEICAKENVGVYDPQIKFWPGVFSRCCSQCRTIIDGEIQTLPVWIEYQRAGCQMQILFAEIGGTGFDNETLAYSEADALLTKRHELEVTARGEVLRMIRELRETHANPAYQAK